jgi:hypothetical protein
MYALIVARLHSSRTQAPSTLALASVAAAQMGAAALHAGVSSFLQPDPAEATAASKTVTRVLHAMPTKPA